MGEGRMKRSSRLFAFLGVVFSCLSVVACLFSIPLLFHYVQLLQATVHNDLEFCHVKSKEVWKEAASIIHRDKPRWEQERIARAVDTLLHQKRQNPQEFVPNPRTPGVKKQVELPKKQEGQFVQGKPKPIKLAKTVDPRTKVSAILSFDSNSVNNVPVETKSAAVQQSPKQFNNDAGSQPLHDTPPASGSCCTCHKGPIGPPGVPGYDGRAGMDGDDGKPGDVGPPAKLNYDATTLLPHDCPCVASPGDIGAAGPKGPAGKAGSPGGNGEDGKGGDNGIRGDAGGAGTQGKAGAKGPPGDDGPVIPAASLPAGAAGKPGKDGDNGIRGADGPPGKGGPNGSPGDNGERGTQGKDGEKGSDGKPGAKGPPGPKGGCAHCPPPRTAPGY